jgi:hypothetical protein
MAIPYFGRYPPGISQGLGGGITEITMTPPLASTGGTTPTHSISAATAANAGSMSAADKAFLDTLPVNGELQKFADTDPATPMSQSIVFTGSPYATEGTVQFWPNDNLIANDTNYATFNAYMHDGSGGSISEVGTVSTTIVGGTGDVVAFSPLTVANNVELQAGYIITVDIEKVNGGVSVPHGKFVYTGLRL